MRRLLIISASVAGALAALVVLAWVLVFYTPPGRTMLKGVIESALGGALNSTVTVGALGGSLPGHITLEDVVLADEQGPWLTAQRAEVRWRPFDYLRNRITVDDAALTGAHILRDPPGGEPAPEDEARQIRVVDNAPVIDIKTLTINAMRVDVNGAARRLDGAGALELDGPEISLRLTLTSDGGDHADIAFEKSPRADRFFLDAALNAEPGGAIATLLGLNGPLSLIAASDGGVAAAELKLEGTIGYYGGVELTAKGDLANFTGADIDLRFAPGERLAHIGELAEPVSLRAQYDSNEDGGALTIGSLTSSIGEIDGGLLWLAPKGFVEHLTAKLSINLAEGYQPTIQSLAGPTLLLDGELTWRREDYGVKAVVTGASTTLTVESGVTDLRRTLAGDMTLTVAPDEAASPALQNGLTLTARLDADFGAEAVFDAAKLTTGDGSRYSGGGAYGFRDKSLALTGDFVVTPSFAARLAPGVAPAGDFAGDIDLSGPLTRFTLKTAFETPQLRINDSALPAMSVEAALSGLPKLPTGDVSARARDGGPRRLDAQLRSSEDGTIRIPRLDYAGRGFELDGSGRIEPDRQTLNLDLAYKGEDGAEPWPGFLVAGDLKATGVLSRDDALNKMTATAGSLQFNSIAVEGLSLTAEGPPGAVNIELASNRLSTPQTGALVDLSATAQLDARTAPKLTLTVFEALIQETQARLTAPARISFEDGVAIDNLRLAYGRNGAIAVDGAFSDTRWRAGAQLEQVNIPNADGQISLTLDLDTNRKTPASGEFHLRSLLLKEEEASIHGSFAWDGVALRITDNNEDPSLDMDVRLPARLLKSPSLSIDTSGQLSGEIHYGGDFEAVAAYLPPVVQTIEGDLTVDFALAGTLAEPSLSGGAKLTDGAYTEIESGFSLAGLHAEATADYGGAGSTIEFSGGARGAGQERNDAITFKGGLTVGDTSNLDLVVKLDRAELAAHPINNLRANGEITVGGALNALVARGDISITELDAEIATPENTGLVNIDVIALNKDAAATEPEGTEAPRKSGLAFTIRISADDRIFIRGRGLESEWSAEVSAVNGREEPLILGDLTLRRGWLDFSGRRFDLTRGSVAFDRLATNNPLLDIRAEHETSDGVTAAIVISGRALDPKVELTSIPALPSEDVMALILFGKPAGELSPFESLQTAEALASLSGVGPFGGEGITGRLRRTVGLDLLNVDIDPENGGGSLTVGKYVADGFFVSASQDAEGRNGSVRVKYEITDNITVETEIEQTGDQTVSANWKKDF